MVRKLKGCSPTASMRCSRGSRPYSVEGGEEVEAGEAEVAEGIKGSREANCGNRRQSQLATSCLLGSGAPKPAR